jgi:hypothetical protein
LNRNTFNGSSKPIASADRIHSEIERRLEDAFKSERRCYGCGAPWPVLLIERRGDGVNWTINEFPRMPAGCASFLMSVISEVMYSYDLEEPARDQPANHAPAPRQGRPVADKIVNRVNVKG